VDDSGNSIVTTVKAPQATDDAFDAFASKFDKAAELDSSTSPFYDPFTNGSGSGQTAMDTSSDGNFYYFDIIFFKQST
jgi:hypothetical protein